MDAAIADVRAATKRADVKAAMEDVQQVWNDTLPAINLFAAEWWYAIDPAVQSVVWSRDVVPMFHDAYLAEGS